MSNEEKIKSVKKKGSKGERKKMNTRKSEKKERGKQKEMPAVAWWAAESLYLEDLHGTPICSFFSPAPSLPSS